MRQLIYLSNQGIQLHFPEPLDFVAESGGFLEFQIGRCFAHLGFDVLDDGGEVGADDLACRVMRTVKGSGRRDRSA